MRNRLRAEMQSFWRLRLCSFVFFFLNDPAPPDISPLPLHAALPFGAEVTRLDDIGASRAHRGDGFDRHHRVDELAALAAVGFRDRDPEEPLRRHELGDVPRVFRRVDRKSTRLNSSHSQISYAVFCLK